MRMFENRRGTLPHYRIDATCVSGTQLHRVQNAIIGIQLMRAVGFRARFALPEQETDDNYTWTWKKEKKRREKEEEEEEEKREKERKEGRKILP